MPRHNLRHPHHGKKGPPFKGAALPFAPNPFTKTATKKKGKK